MSGGCPYASPPLPSHPQLLYKWSLPPPDFRKPSHHLSSPTLQQVSSLSSTPPPPRLRPHPARDGPRGAPQDRLREVQDRGLRPEAGSLRAPQGPPVTQVHGVCVRRLARVPVGDPGPGAWRGLHRPQHRCHGPVLLQEQTHRCRVGHRVRRLRPQGQGHRGDRPQPLRRDQGPPQPQGWRRRHLPLRRGLASSRTGSGSGSRPGRRSRPSAPRCLSRTSAASWKRRPSMCPSRTSAPTRSSRRAWPTEPSSWSAATTTSSPASSTHGSCILISPPISQLQHIHPYTRTYMISKIPWDRCIDLNAMAHAPARYFPAVVDAMARCQFCKSFWWMVGRLCY